MILNTRLFFIALLFTGFIKAQEQEMLPNQYSEDPETVFFNFELYYPVSLGNSTYSDYKPYILVQSEANIKKAYSILESLETKEILEFLEDF